MFSVVLCNQTNACLLVYVLGECLYDMMLVSYVATFECRLYQFWMFGKIPRILFLENYSYKLVETRSTIRRTCHHRFRYFPEITKAITVLPYSRQSISTYYVFMLECTRSQLTNIQGNVGFNYTTV